MQVAIKCLQQREWSKFHTVGGIFQLCSICVLKLYLLIPRAVSNELKCSWWVISNLLNITEPIKLTNLRTDIKTRVPLPLIFLEKVFVTQNCFLISPFSPYLTFCIRNSLIQRLFDPHLKHKTHKQLRTLRAFEDFGNAVDRSKQSSALCCKHQRHRHI